MRKAAGVQSPRRQESEGQKFFPDRPRAQKTKILLNAAFQENLKAGTYHPGARASDVCQQYNLFVSLQKVSLTAKNWKNPYVFKNKIRLPHQIQVLGRIGQGNGKQGACWQGGEWGAGIARR